MSDYFDRIERQIMRSVEAGAPRGSRFRLRLDLVVPALSVAIVLAIAVVFLGVHRASSPGSGARGGVEIRYAAGPTPQTPDVTKAALERTIAVMRARAAAFGISGATFRTVGAHEITVRLPGPTDLARAESELGTTARLNFYDWEANALTPTGRAVAGQLRARDQAATIVSQGSGSTAAGGPGAGSLSLYDAVRLAAKEPLERSDDNARLGSEYYLFGAPNSVACATAARAVGNAPVAGTHCLLAGPAADLRELDAEMPHGVRVSQGQLLVIRQGTIVLKATPVSAFSEAFAGAPAARYYVLKDHVSLFGQDITHPQQRTDQAGSPEVTFGFNAVGAARFHKLTSTIAHRGDLLSGSGTTLNQHFAVALDAELITVPQIDFRTYPDGISGSGGADVIGGFTIKSARDIATQLRLGALPIHLQLVSTKALSAGG